MKGAHSCHTKLALLAGTYFPSFQFLASCFILLQHRLLWRKCVWCMPIRVHQNLFFIFPYSSAVRPQVRLPFLFFSPPVLATHSPRPYFRSIMTTIKSICSDTLLFFLFSIVHLQGFISIRSISHHRIKRLKINIVMAGGMAIVSPIQIGKLRKILTSRWKGKSNSQHLINISFEWGRSSWMGFRIFLGGQTGRFFISFQFRTSVKVDKKLFPPGPDKSTA